MNLKDLTIELLQDLTDDELDEAVAILGKGWEKRRNYVWPRQYIYRDAMNCVVCSHSEYHPTRNWEQAGELLEEFYITLNPVSSIEWNAFATKVGHRYQPAPNPRRAICLAVVAMKLRGEE